MLPHKQRMQKKVGRVEAQKLDTYRVQVISFAKNRDWEIANMESAVSRVYERHMMETLEKVIEQPLWINEDANTYMNSSSIVLPESNALQYPMN